MILAALYLVQTYQSLPAVPYCTVAGKTLTMNAFLPEAPTRPAPAMIEIHGGWFVGGGPASGVPDVLARKGVAFFSISYRLGDEGGFPECIRDCRNAVRFVRKNAARFHIDPKRIAVMGGSAGGYLALMVAMVPRNFNDGGPTEDLKGVSADVCGAFSWIAPTDLVRFWNQGPDDVAIGPDGTKSFRRWNDAIPNDARPHLRALFHGRTPETADGVELYKRMSPIDQVRRRLPPTLICDGESDPIVPGHMGRDLHDRLRAAGDDSTYWMTPGGGHAYPGGPGFDSVLDAFLTRTLSPHK